MKTIETNHEYRIDLENCPLEVALTQPLSHQDALADRFAVTLRRGMTPADLTGMKATAYLTFQTTRQTLPLEGAVSGSTAEVTLTAESYAVPGPFTLALQLSSGEVRHTVLRVQGAIARSATEEVLSSGELLPTLPELLDQIAGMQSATAQSLEATETTLAAAEENRAAADECRAVLAEATALTASFAPPILVTGEGRIIHAADAAAGRAVQGLTLRGESTQADAPAPDAPSEIVSIGDGDGLALEICGRNLYDNANIAQSATGGAQCTYTMAEDGWVDVTSQKQFDYLLNDRFFAGGTTYTTRFEVEVYDRPEGETGLTLIVADVNGSTSRPITANGSYTYIVSFTPAKSGVYRIRTYANYNSAVPAKVRFRTTCVAGSYTAATMPPWEAYAGQTLALNAQLRAVPVASGGNVTDEAGQQWVTDEVDFDRGVLIQRVKALSLDGSEEWKTRVAERACFHLTLEDAVLPTDVNDLSPSLCTRLTRSTYGTVLSGQEDNTIAVYNTGVYVNLPDDCSTLALGTAWLAEHPMELLYALAEPVETPLDAPLLAQVLALRSQPGTTILAGGAPISVQYVADTKRYIDQRLDALAQALGA